jgi:DNA-binding LacI/PurR family transcriptional regulator
VSYVVNNGPRPVAEETRERVQLVIDQLGYRPNALARSLKTGKTQTIGFLVQSLLQSFTVSLVNAVEDNLAKHNYNLILSSTHEDSARELRLLEDLSEQSIDGLLFIPASPHNSHQVETLIEAGLPVIFLDRNIPGVSADAVMTDNHSAAKQLTQHLIQKGCRHIICLSFSREASSAVDRVAGYRQAMIEHGLPVNDDMVRVVEYASGVIDPHELLDYIDTRGLPDGIICTTDDLIVETIKTLKQRGIKVPEQVLIGGGFVRSAWADLLEIDMPIVHQDFHQIAQRAVERLLARIEGDTSPPSIEYINAQFCFDDNERQN